MKLLRQNLIKRNKKGKGEQILSHFTSNKEFKTQDDMILSLLLLLLFLLFFMSIIIIIIKSINLIKFLFC